jgi:hypothetical protein
VSCDQGSIIAHEYYFQAATKTRKSKALTKNPILEIDADSGFSGSDINHDGQPG